MTFLKFSKNMLLATALLDLTEVNGMMREVGREEQPFYRVGDRVSARENIGFSERDRPIAAGTQGDITVADSPTSGGTVAVRWDDDIDRETCRVMIDQIQKEHLQATPVPAAPTPTSTTQVHEVTQTPVPAASAPAPSVNEVTENNGSSIGKSSIFAVGAATLSAAAGLAYHYDIFPNYGSWLVGGVGGFIGVSFLGAHCCSRSEPRKHDI